MKKNIKATSYEESRFLRLPLVTRAKLSKEDKESIELLIDKVYSEGYEDGKKQR
jgi:hypothetical protein